MNEPTPIPTAGRPPVSESDLRRWLKNMVWFHRFSPDEISQATGLAADAIEEAMDRFQIFPSTGPPRARAGLRVLPYPGGRHPRAGFLDGAVDPQRDTKFSVFLPWDPESYLVIDLPEAIWSNRGLLYLAHRHQGHPTLWEEQAIALEPREWEVREDGVLTHERTLPDGVCFGAQVVPSAEAVHMELWLENGTGETLTDLRVQVCVLLSRAAGFEPQSSANKVVWGPYTACGDEAGNRWIITAWDPLWRTWDNPDCPCMHSDPQFSDCPPGATRRLRGWLSFYEGALLTGELVRIERTGWRDRPPAEGGVAAQGVVLDADREEPIPARVHVQRDDGTWHRIESEGGDAVHYDRRQPHLPHSEEVHTAVSADPFVARLEPGRYTFRVERGKEYIPEIRPVVVGPQPLHLVFRLRRWIDLAARGWYSGDTHVHRSLAELPTAMLAEDLNVALPLTYWVAQSDLPPAESNDPDLTPDPQLIEVDSTHVIHPVNTEYEITRVGPHRHVMGSVFALNHRTPLPVGVPPVGPAVAAARAQGALLDLDKHAWPWSLMLAVNGYADLFELANNHLWQTGFGFNCWELVPLPDWMDIERDEHGMTEWGWADYGFQVYYLLLNCGFRLRVSAGTASGVHPVPLGFGRVYVHLPQGFSYDDWIAGLNAGHSFVTTGPMLDVTVNQQPPGSVFNQTSSESAALQLAGTVESRRPLDRIELVVNGRVDRILEPANHPAAQGGFASAIDEEVQADGSFWLVVRAFERHPRGRLRFAHTNPWYIDVPGRPVRPRPEEADYLVLRLEEERARNLDRLSTAALREYEQALAIAQRIEEASRESG